MSGISHLFDPESFRAEGHKMVDALADWLKVTLNPDVETKVIDWTEPDAEYQDWSTFHSKDTETIFSKILNRSIRIHHPQYMGHQVCAPAPLTALAAFEGALLNNGGAVFEMGQASCTLEKYLIDRFKSWFGYDDKGDGFFTSGGTIANITALLCARSVMAEEDVWQKGTGRQYAVIVSEEAHYCVDRAVRIMGWGSEGIILIPVDEQYKMRTDLLEYNYNKAIGEGKQIIAVVGSAPSTATGMYDNLLEIGAFCRSKNLWFHIDAAHGGPAVFSEKYKFLMDGCGLADSITVDAHKMMMVPGLTTMLFFRDYRHSYQTFAQKAHYLWGNDEPEWYNLGKRTMECTKLMMSIRVYVILQTYGIHIFGEFVEYCYDLADLFYNLILQQPRLEAPVAPESNIVCFRYCREDCADLNEINQKIRRRILEEGKFYIVQTRLKDKVFLRTTLISPATGVKHIEHLIREVVSIGDSIFENKENEII
jgi:L-2,4-diaminobutyrate decarboxylase